MSTVRPQRILRGIALGVLALGWVLLALCFFGVELPRPPLGGEDRASGSPIDFTAGDTTPVPPPAPPPLLQPPPPQTVTDGETAPDPVSSRRGTAAAPRNLILLLGDGMGFSHVAAARAARRGARRPLLFERLPFTAVVDTFSAHSLYTDSAAGATALASGVAVPPGRLSVDQEGRPLRTLFEAARDDGKALGVITDSYLWDASPGAFLVHRESRREYAAILADLAAAEVEVLVGESSDHDGTENAAAVLAENYRLARSWDELEAAEQAADPVAGLFTPGSIADGAASPTLPELTAWAIRRLARNPRGFFLFVETEEPDTGSHRHQIERVLDGIAALDAAVAKSLEAPAGTLVVVTADHETGGLGIVGGSRDGALEVAWTSNNHTAEPVPLYAWGPGAERFTGSFPNTAVAHRLAELFGYDLTPAP